ncbi:MAG: Mitochondrial translocator assembly and maintenance protein 41 [Cirrosporium novae-zelandiae]|nr:MAG: Mitochondrial translocator assembly and maintenance protein 41 [Cirrosporium novae-zelandiae]
MSLRTLPRLRNLVAPYEGSYTQIPPFPTIRHRRPGFYLRTFASESLNPAPNLKKDTTQPNLSQPDLQPAKSSSSSSSSNDASSTTSSSTLDWDENPDLNISRFSELPSSDFGYNQHMIINQEFKEALRQIIWKFRAPVVYAFAYGSGVFPQSKGPLASNPSPHPSPNQAISTVQRGEGKMIDFIFGVSHSQHWHSLNLTQHRDHYSALGSLGSYAVSRVQDDWGAGVYFNTHVIVNGTLIKYGVVHLETLCRDLSEWDTLYLAGRLQKPVKILRDNPRVRLANQVNLLSAVRTALLLLPVSFTEKELYRTIASISYMGDMRMSLPTENANKVANIVDHQLANFRQLYAPLIDTLPNVHFRDARCNDPEWKEDPEANVSLEQDMDVVKRGNMVRRLPKAFRKRLYFEFQSKYQISQKDFQKMLDGTQDESPDRIHRRQGGKFEQKVAADDGLDREVKDAIRKTIKWPSTTQSIKGAFTGGILKSWRYVKEKREKYRDGQKANALEENTSEKKDS